MSDRSETVSFRLPSAFYRQLLSEAKDQSFKSPHDFARQLVIKALGNVESDQQMSELRDLRRTMDTLRDDLATATGALLAYAGKWTPEQARAWVQETLLQK